MYLPVSNRLAVRTLTVLLLFGALSAFVGSVLAIVLNGAGVPLDRAGQRSQGGNREDPGVQGDGAVLRQGRERRTLSSTGYSVNSICPYSFQIPNSQ